MTPPTPLTTAEIEALDSKAPVLWTPDECVRLIATARLAPQWRPGTEVPPQYLPVLTHDEDAELVVVLFGQWHRMFGRERIPIAAPQWWTNPPTPPGA